MAMLPQNMYRQVYIIYIIHSYDKAQMQGMKGKDNSIFGVNVFNDFNNIPAPAENVVAV